MVSLPNDTVPVTSASTPASLGERASNSSATRGRPPVMSRVFEVSCGMRASTSPTPTCWPSLTVMIEPIWKVMLTGSSVPAIFTSLPSSSSSFTCGRKPLACAAPRRFGSITTSVDRPVTSSICLATVTPSSTFSNLTLPAYSVMIGRVCGSQVASTLTGLDRTVTVAYRQHGAVRHLVTFALAAVIVVNHTSPVREIATCSPRALVT